MRVMGMDCNSKKLSYVITKDGEIETYGEVYFTEENFHDRLGQAQKVVGDMLHVFGELDFLGFEKAIKAKSVDTALKLGYMFGSVLGALSDLDTTMVEVQPLVWQSWAGNKNILGNERKALLAEHPELKTKSQIATFIRNYRKERTLKFVEEQTGIRLPNDDLGDAACLSLYVADKMKDLYDD